MARGGPPSERALQTYGYPLFRLGGGALAASAIVINVVAGRATLGNLAALIGGLAAWSLVSWLALTRWYGRIGRVDLGILVAFGDVVVWILLVYLTGAERSLLFFLILLPAADLRTTNFRLVLLFGHFSIACYMLLLAYVAVVHRPIDSPAEMVKVAILYLANLHLAFTAKAAQRVDTARNRARAAKTSFLANVSHEMRTPLNGVIGGTRLLESTELSAAQRHHVAMVRNSAETLLQLVDEILDVSKLEASKLTIEPITFSLRATLAEALRPLTPAADIKGLLLRMRVSDEVPDTLVGDPVRLRQIVVNLVSNAIKFTDDGEIEVRLTLEPGDGDAIVLHLTVRDTGIGIAPERRQAIFEAFTQAEGSTTRTRGGTGLGLTIASRLAELMGGRLWVDSELGRGSTFHVTLRMRLAPPRAEPPAPELAGLTALVAEPNQVHRAALVDMLDVWGLSTTQAESSQEVLSQVARARDAGRPFDVLFLGIDLIGMDGLRLVERLRKADAFAGSIVMLMRAVARRGDRERCAELGVNAVVTRPFSQSEILDALALALALARPVTAGPPLQPRRPLTILLADDNAVNREVAISYLGGWGHSVTPVQDGVQALAMLERRRFDVAILDVHMPGADGFQVTSEIRRRETATGERLVIIAMTAHSMPGDRERCLAAGMDGYVAKPVQAERLFETLESLTAPTADFGAALLERAGGNAALQQRMARLFLEHAPDARARLHDALARRDAAALAASAHWFKGAVGNFPAPAATEASARVERLARSGNFDAAAAACAPLDSELDRLAQALAALVGAQGMVDRSKADRSSTSSLSDTV
jgi:two-component system, sensor histidine kinase and response regulator